MVKNLLLWVVIAVILVTAFSKFGPTQPHSQEISYSNFYTQLKQGNVRKVTIENGQILRGETSSDTYFSTYIPMRNDIALLGDLVNSGVDVKGRPKQQDSLFLQLFA